MQTDSNKSRVNCLITLSTYRSVFEKRGRGFGGDARYKSLQWNCSFSEQAWGFILLIYFNQLLAMSTILGLKFYLEPLVLGVYY